LAVRGVAVAPAGSMAEGNVTVVGLATQFVGPVQYKPIWISTYRADGTFVNQVSLSVGPDDQVFAFPTKHLVVDSLGNLIMAGNYTGTATFGATTLTSTNTIVPGGVRYSEY